MAFKPTLANLPYGNVVAIAKKMANPSDYLEFALSCKSIATSALNVDAFPEKPTASDVKIKFDIEQLSNQNHFFLTVLDGYNFTSCTEEEFHRRLFPLRGQRIKELRVLDLSKEPTAFSIDYIRIFLEPYNITTHLFGCNKLELNCGPYLESLADLINQLEVAKISTSQLPPFPGGVGGPSGLGFLGDRRHKIMNVELSSRPKLAADFFGEVPFIKFITDPNFTCRQVVEYSVEITKIMKNYASHSSKPLRTNRVKMFNYFIKNPLPPDEFIKPLEDEVECYYEKTYAGDNAFQKYTEFYGVCPTKELLRPWTDIPVPLLIHCVIEEFLDPFGTLICGYYTFIPVKSLRQLKYITVPYRKKTKPPMDFEYFEKYIKSEYFDPLAMLVK